MGYLGRRIGLSQDKGDSTPSGADGAVGGGLLDLVASGYFQRQGNVYNSPGAAPSGMVATGGIIGDYTHPDGTIYRSHVFTSSGTFEVTSLATGDTPNTLQYLVVAGGGGGAARHGGGGGAGGLLVSPGFPGVPTSQNQSGTSITVTTVPDPHSVTIGAGGVGGIGPTSIADSRAAGAQGSPSSFGPVTATGGGYGASSMPGPPYANPGGPGGSGGGGSHFSTSVYGNPGPATNYPGPTQQGHPAGTSGPGVPAHGCGGGGGAGGIGGNASSPKTGGAGGAGLTVYIAGPPTSPAPENSYAGGGGGGGDTAGPASPIGGGGAGGAIGETSGNRAGDGVSGTGGGGGGHRTDPDGDGGQGGSGVVVVRYEIGSVSIEKATGGAISFYGGKTIHTFTGSGDFNNTSGGNLSVEYVVIGGGGAGGGAAPNNSAGGGGGGAGAYRTATSFTVSPGPNTVTIGAGGARSKNRTIPGSNTVFSTITSGGGGGGGSGTDGNTVSDAPTPTATGGSGGGVYNDPGGAGGTYGNNGGSSGGSSPYNASGGGGAGGAGSPTDPNSNVGHGGIGVQLPSTFRNPESATSLGAPGPGGGNYWVAGGGGGAPGSPIPSATAGGVGGGTGSVTPYAGGGPGAPGPGPEANGTPGAMNTGAGGGGSSINDATYSGAGGSGIVLIAYPT